MNEFEKSLNRIDELCNKNGIRYAIIGGLAVIAYGSHRTTKDIDLTVLCELEDMENIFTIFSSEFSALPEDPLIFFKKNFVLPSKDKLNEIRIDISSGLTGFDKDVIEHRKRLKFGNTEFYVCSLEDLIIYKLFAARYQDLADVEELISANKNIINKNYLESKVMEFYDLEREDMKSNLDKFFK